MDPKKGKSVTTSVPSISIKFHANAEQIEELRLSDDDASNSEERNLQISSVNPASSASDHETSPLKLFPKLVKRSTSVDVSAQSLSSSPPSDPWRFFTDIKKSVEEKITEIKARHEEGSPSHKAKGELKTHKDSKSEKFSNNKDNSSFSDSEEQSESSISKTCGFISTTEGVEMSSDDETSSIDKEKKVHSSPNVIRQRFRFLKSHSQKYPVKEGSVNINSLSKLYNINTENVEQALPEHMEDVESAIDALEETDFRRESCDGMEKRIGHEEIVIKVAQKINNIEVDTENFVNVKEISGSDVAKSFFAGNKTMSAVFAPTGFVDVRTVRQSGNDSNIVPYVLLCIYIVLYAILHTFTPYLAGMVLGASVALILGYIYIKLYTTSVTTVATNTGMNVGGFSNRIMEIPAVKEYQPLTKYEGWLNEYPDAYDPLTYHISQTQSVFLRLQGNLLRISHSKSKVPKRAMWNENDIKASFSHHRIYNLLQAKVTLLPEGLTKIRLWSKKYPICITLNKDQMNFDPSILKIGVEEEKEEKNGDKTKSPLRKKKFTFKKREYPYMAQRFSQLTQDQDIDLDSDSRASTPSPEISDLMPDEVVPPDDQDEKHEEDDMHSLPDDWSDASQNVSTKSFKSINKSPAKHHSSTQHNLDQNKKDSSSEIKLYLFGRTDREKEYWFRRFAAATHHTEETITLGGDNDVKETDSNNEMIKTEMEYMKYMTFFNKPSRKKSKQDKLDKDSEISQASEEVEDRSDGQLWFNAIVGRVLFDCMRDPGFTKKVQNRIQKKLQTIKLPYFIEEITLTELNLGKTPPFVLRTEKPVLDDRGLWVDLDISYQGLVVLTLQTKINLMKLKNPQLHDRRLSEIKSAIYHSDVDDSAESSSDEDGPQEILIPKEGGSTLPPPAHGSKKFIKMVDRIAESKFFQAATENRYIKKAMEGVSNTELRLTVEIKALSGTVVLNIPPPPSDRIWVGFRPVPELILTACPIVGDRNVTYAMVTSWIEKKLLQEFQKVMVIPNMEDFVVPVMDPKLPE